MEYNAWLRTLRYKALYGGLTKFLTAELLKNNTFPGLAARYIEITFVISPA